VARVRSPGFAGRVRIEDFDPDAEPATVRAMYEMYQAGLPEDDPDGPPYGERIFTEWVRAGWSGEPRERAVAISGPGGSPAGAYVLALPNRKNTHVGELTVMVTPAARRGGVGTALLRHAVAKAAGHGRTLLTGETRCDSPGAAFCAAVGARGGVRDIRRVLDTASIPAGKLAALRGRAEAAAQGYSLVRWSGPTPEEDLEGVAVVSAAMADAPRNPGMEAHRPDVERVRDGERRSEAIGLHRYSVAARCDSTGELAGLTQIAVDSQDADWGFQLVTAVTREHRGHRLGLLVKVAMLEMLAAAEPALAHIMTGNADSNKHMIAINEEIGFRVLDEWQSWQLDISPSTTSTLTTSTTVPISTTARTSTA
jgi:GNAT superfamily N-acetyltransferase